MLDIQTVQLTDVTRRTATTDLRARLVRVPAKRMVQGTGLTFVAMALAACGGSDEPSANDTRLTLTFEDGTYSASDVAGFSLTDPTRASLAVADAPDDVYTIQLTGRGTGVLEFAFADAQDVVILEAGSTISGFTTLRVIEGTLDATLATISDVVRVEVASGIKLTLAQVREIPVLVSNSETGRIEITVSTVAEAQELTALISAGTVQLFGAAESITVVPVVGSAVTVEEIAEQIVTVREAVRPAEEAPPPPAEVTPPTSAPAPPEIIDTPPPPTLTATLANDGTISFGGTATGTITATFDTSETGSSVTFTRGGVSSGPVSLTNVETLTLTKPEGVTVAVNAPAGAVLVGTETNEIWNISMTYHTAIQVAVDAAKVGDTVLVGSGDFVTNKQINVDKGITLRGAGESQTVIDAREVINAYGISSAGVAANGVSFEDFTLYGPTNALNTAFGLKLSGMEDASVKNVTVQGSGRSEVDLNGVKNAVLTNVTAKGAPVVVGEVAVTPGVGFAISNSEGVTLTNIATDGNNLWGGVALFAGFGSGLDNKGIKFEGGFDVRELSPLYTQEKAGSNKSVTVDTFPFNDVWTVTNSVFRGDGPEFKFIFGTEQAAKNFATSPGQLAGSVVEGPDGALYLFDGMNLQATINAVSNTVSDGDTVNIGPDVYIGKFLSGGIASDTITGTATNEIIRGREGKDIIDISAGGSNIIIFEASGAANGLDTITGFNGGANVGVSDVLSFGLFQNIAGIANFVNGGDITLFSAGTDNTDITGKIALLTGEATATEATLAAKAVFDAINGQVFNIADNGKAVVLVETDAAGKAFVVFVDAKLTGDEKLQAEDVITVADLGEFNLDTLITANFIL